MKNNDIYWEILSLKTQNPTSLSIWLDLFPFLEHADWKTIFNTVYTVCKEPYLQSFQYKILHRTLNCNYNLFKWSIIDSGMCSFCHNNIDTLEHNLYYCYNTKVFWVRVNKWFMTVTQVKFNFSICEILFGIVVTSTLDSHVFMFNYLVLLGKWYINSQKVKKRQLMFCEFLLFVKCKLENIKMSFIMYKNLDLFIERYGRLYQHLSVLEL